MKRSSFPHENRSPLSRIVRGSLWSVLGNGAARMFAIATALAAARLLGREGFGTLALVQLTITTAGTLVSGQLAQAATRFVSQFRESSAAKATAVARLVTMLSAAFGLAAMLALLLLSDWISRQLLRQPSMAPLLRLASPAVPCVLIAGAQAAILNGYEAFSLAARVNAFGSAALFLGVLTGGFSAGVNGAALGWVLGNGALCLFGYVALRKFRVVSPTDAGVRANFPISALLSYSLPLFGSSMVFAAILLYANALLGEKHSLSEVALYAAADRIHLILLFVPTAVLSAMFPILSNLHSHGDFSGCRKVLRSVLQIGALVVVVPAALLGFFSSRVCSLFGTEFGAGGPVLAILCVATLFEALNILFGYLMIIAGRVWLRSCIDIGLTLVLGSCATIWIPRFGSEGLAAAYAASFAAAVMVLAASLNLIRAPRRKEVAAFMPSSMPNPLELGCARRFNRGSWYPFVK